MLGRKLSVHLFPREGSWSGCAFSKKVLDSLPQALVEAG